MNTYFVYTKQFEELYNCSFYSIDQVPLEERQHNVLGPFFIAVFLILYIPCLISIQRHTKLPCYKFMYCIGIADVFCLFINGLFTGYFAIIGAVYCTYPVLIYWLGTCGLCLWAFETSLAMCLAINRCVEMASPNWGRTLYNGNRTYLWFLPPFLYTMYFLIFTKPVFFTSIYMSWFFNPHAGYHDDYGLIYNNFMHSLHNVCLLFGLSGTYIIFLVILITKSKTYNLDKKRSSFQKASFIQVLLISIVNATAAAIYVYMQFVHISQAIIVLGSFMWMSAHGMPSIIYVTMNKTIKNDCKRMMPFLFKNKVNSLSSQYPTGSTMRVAGQEITKREESTDLDSDMVA